MGKCKFKKADKEVSFGSLILKNITVNVKAEISMLVFCYTQDFLLLSARIIVGLFPL